MEEECCPKFNPKPWDNKTFSWKNKQFVKDRIFTLFYIPINFGGIMKRLNKDIEKVNAKIPDWLSLADHTSKWNMNIYLAVDRKIPNANNVKISGKFLSRIYEGPFKDTKKWCENFERYAKGKKLDIDKQYIWYTTCPKCAKKYGKNYVVIIGKIK